MSAVPAILVCLCVGFAGRTATRHAPLWVQGVTFAAVVAFGVLMGAMVK